MIHTCRSIMDTTCSIFQRILCGKTNEEIRDILVGKKKGVILTFGWVMIVNTFFRTLSLAGIVNQMRDVTSLSVAIMALLFGLIGVLLQVYLPYKDLEIGMAESICMLLLSIICYAASLKDFFQGHRMSAIFEAER